MGTHRTLDTTARLLYHKNALTKRLYVKAKILKTTRMEQGVTMAYKKPLPVKFLFTAIILISIPTLLTACNNQAKVYDVGIYISGVNLDSRIQGLKDGLQSLGYNENINIRYHELNTTKMTAAQETIALKDFAAKNYDVYWVINGSGGVKAKQTITNRPIIVAGLVDAVATNTVKSLDHPGGNLTGIDSLSFQEDPARLDLLLQLDPTIRKVYFVYDTTSVYSTQANLAATRQEAQKLDVTLLDMPYKGTDKAAASATLLKMSSKEAQAIITLGLSPFLNAADVLKQVVDREKLLLIGTDRSNLNYDAIFSYGGNDTAIGQQSASYVDKILLGTDPGSLPVQPIDQINFVLNQKLANQFGINIPTTLTEAADSIVN